MASDSIYGTLNLLILKVLNDGPAHGLAVKQRIENLAGGQLNVGPGALYPALHRLHRARLLSAEWGVSGKNRPAKVYRLTSKGQQRLRSEIRSWQRHIRSVKAVLEGG